jgi:hypothetical protein
VGETSQNVLVRYTVDPSGNMRVNFEVTVCSVLGKQTVLMSWLWIVHQLLWFDFTNQRLCAAVSYIFITGNMISANSILLEDGWMEAARSSETLVNFYQTTWCYNPEDSHIRTNRRENFESYSVYYCIAFTFYACQQILWRSFTHQGIENWV